MGEKEQSGKPAGHQERICKLKKDGKLEEIDRLELRPIVYCNKCKAKANHPSYLCNPRALKAPKVQKV
ncbi:MAG: hypothetical protein A2075_10955 [Geobacteraceae bacterium GWC2_58_44]|nr:MAG: hypothetical protein A2075_10955 [Geobacteraceae bacterium GWC2_58_44]HBG07971.1 hypothetical protein [Geobacter sp.]